MECPITKQVIDHYEEGLKYFKKSNIVGCVLQGSQNYGLQTSTSDVDTKLIVVPSFKDIVLNKPAVSTTHIRENNEHTDFKDIRLYIQTLRKQNINYIETLFTSYYVINTQFAEQWNRLVENREAIGRLNPYQAIKTMRGVALSEFKQMYHPTEGRVEIFNKFGYDPKAYSHLCRIYEFMQGYYLGCPYEDCLIPPNIEFLKYAKMGVFRENEVAVHSKSIVDGIEALSEIAFKAYENKENEDVVSFLEDVQYEIMKIAIGREFE